MGNSQDLQCTRVWQTCYKILTSDAQAHFGQEESLQPFFVRALQPSMKNPRSQLFVTKQLDRGIWFHKGEYLENCDTCFLNRRNRVDRAELHPSCCERSNRARSFACPSYCAC